VELDRLVEKLHTWSGSNKIQIVIYFDKAHSLTEVKPNDLDEKALYN
jgi:hypothetical protein